ncbi:NAD(P)-binding domain-containing protein [Streptomyces sp. NPDC098781]|uniref:NAD(P)-binding domain-containing protein n=1 Tax=Streptomyces sp. NPDC098781 TaxID=3366097 RepID=UPI0038205511
MDQPSVGILHPGSMGAAVASCAATNAATVLWCTDRRSPASAARAQQLGLEPVPTLHKLLDRSDVVISLCPPAAVEDVAHEVASFPYAGLYVEANAINPERALGIARLLGPDATVVDGAVVGSPPMNGKRPTLYCPARPPRPNAWSHSSPAPRCLANHEHRIEWDLRTPSHPTL